MLDLATDDSGTAETGVPEVSVALRPRALILLGTLASRRGDYALSSSFIERCVALSREDGDFAMLPSALAALGLSLWLASAQDRAAEVLTESPGLGRELGPPGAVAMTLRHLGLVARWQAQYERAAGLLHESLVQAGWPVWNRGTQSPADCQISAEWPICNVTMRSPGLTSVRGSK